MRVTNSSYAVSLRVAGLVGSMAAVACASQRQAAVNANNSVQEYLTNRSMAQAENLQKLDAWLEGARAMQRDLQQKHGCVGAAMAEGFSYMSDAMSWASFKAENDFFPRCIKPVPGMDVDYSGQKLPFAFYPDVKREVCGSTQLKLPYNYGAWPEGNWAVVFVCGETSKQSK